MAYDRTGEAIADAVSRLAHANVTFVPYHLGYGPTEESVHVAAHPSKPPHQNGDRSVHDRH